MRLPSQQSLLSALIGVVMFATGLVGFDAERVIGAVDDLKIAQAADHTQITLNQNDIAAIKPQLADLSNTTGQLDHRLTIVETKPFTINEADITRALNERSKRMHRK